MNCDGLILAIFILSGCILFGIALKLHVKSLNEYQKFLKDYMEKQNVHSD